MSKKDQVLTDLRALKALLKPKQNWTQGHDVKRRQHGYCYCLRGGIDRVVGGVVLRGNTWLTIPSMASARRAEAVRTALYEVIPTGSSGIIDFNDSDDRKHADIIKLIDVAIAKRREQVRP